MIVSSGRHEGNVTAADRSKSINIMPWEYKSTKVMLRIARTDAGYLAALSRKGPQGSTINFVTNLKSDRLTLRLGVYKQYCDFTTKHVLHLSVAKSIQLS